MTDNISQTEEEAALERIVRNQLKIAELNAENDVLKGFFKGNEAYPIGTKKSVGKFYIKVTSNTRVDDALAKAYLPDRKYTRLTKRVIDGTLAKKSLSADEYAKIIKTYDNRIEIGMN